MGIPSRMDYGYGSGGERKTIAVGPLGGVGETQWWRRAGTAANTHRDGTTGPRSYHSQSCLPSRDRKASN